MTGEGSWQCYSGGEDELRPRGGTPSLLPALLASIASKIMYPRGLLNKLTLMLTDRTLRSSKIHKLASPVHTQARTKASRPRQHLLIFSFLFTNQENKKDDRHNNHNDHPHQSSLPATEESEPQWGAQRSIRAPANKSASPLGRRGRFVKQKTPIVSSL